MKSLLLALSATAALGLSAVSAGAILPAVGTTCSHISGPANMSGGKVRFKSGTTGTIVLNCLVNQEEAQVLVGSHRFVAIYRDSTGTGAGAHMKVELVAIDLGTGARSGELVYNSNDFTATGVNSELGTVMPDANPLKHYFIRVELKRKNTSQTVEYYTGEFLEET
jgi:hypothetical protein